jgi:hypothetical protein
MTLEEIGTWTGDVSQIGPIYPMVGTEGLLTIILIVFWIGWHIWQIRMEERNYSDDMKTLKQGDNMDRALKGERILRPL